jgi:hypothetical protein
VIAAMRLLSAVSFVLAAFAWVPPMIDRAGCAALGAAFLALTVAGRSRVRPATLAEHLSKFTAPE